MNKLPSVLLCFALLSATQFRAQSPDPKTQTGNPPAANVDTEKPDYSKEALVIERLYQRYRFENDGTGRKIATCRIHVLNEGGVQALGQLRFGYNAANERLDIGYVRVIKGDSSVVTAGPEAVQDLSPAVQGGASVYTDYHEKHVTVPSLRPGDTLEYEVTNNLQTAFAPGQFWAQHDFSHAGVVLDERLEIDIPIGRVVKLKTRPGLDPKISDENGRRVYRWTSSHLTSSEETKEGKKKKEAKKQKADEVPDVQLTTFASWEEVGQWYANLEKNRRMPSADVRAKAQDLTKGLHSDLEKTEALYTFVAQNFRYVSLSLGLARYQPQAASDVLRNQYGDCKDKNTLLAALLEAEGFHSSTVLINSFRKLDPDVPSPSQFNHAITLVPIGKDEIWLDTTTEVAPFRLIAYPLRKKQALVIPADGTPHLEETPADPFVPDQELTEIEGKVDESGRLEATITFTARGDSEIMERGAFRRIAPAQWQKFAEGINKTLGGDVSHLKVSDVLATREPFVFSYHVSKGNFVDWSKKKLQLQLPLSFMGLAEVNDAEGDSDDINSGKTEPLKIGPSHEHAYRIKLDFAARYHSVAPVPVSVERDYGSYQSTYKLDGAAFSAERKLRIRLTELPADRAEDYRAFRRSVLADGGQSLSIENTAAETHSAPSDMNVGDLVRSAGEARRNGNYAAAIDLLNRLVGIEPKNKTAWNDLGLAYFDDHQDGLAINAFQKQIEVNSFDQYAYNNLGRVYLRQRKYEEADKWFRKQIEIQPLDKYAHANLGSSLIEQHQYEAALPELEKAASITPDSTGPQLSLGRAYLNLGQDDKAMAAFDKALTISASAYVWNSIAYSLALSKVHLDRARSYAESAVSSTAAALRNVSLSQLNRRDLGHVSSLGSYWDTLGWVALAEGKLELSERYVSAGWLLDGLAEEGDHLGQIYEKRGNKAEAAHLYSLALSAERPEPETRDRLAALVGLDKVDATIEKYKNERLQSRTYRVPNTSKLEGKADFFVLLAHGSSDTPNVEGVSYVTGEAKLRPMSEALKMAKFNQPFPDDAPAKILRRGTLTCRPSEDCSFVLSLPSEVRSIE
jgi:tetratricopeptide (TPR) repeat protein